MKWIKQGKIFDPADHKLANNCSKFAQSPQALVFDDFVRIYFSTRTLDINGKYLSHIAFVDMSKNLRDIIRVSDQPVIPLGGLGCFDEHGIFPFNVVRHEGNILAYTTGWNRRVSVSVDTAIGLAISKDNGLTFHRIGDGPVLAASLYEPCLVGDAFVMIFENIFHMWYIFGIGWKQFHKSIPPDRIYKIGHAVSFDGIEWHKEEANQIISDILGPDECQALPTVICVDKLFHMFFCYRESFNFRQSNGRGYRIGHAWSNDLLNWTRDDDSPALSGTPSSWDSDMQCYPHAFECDGNFYLLYNGNSFGINGFGAAVLEV
jgi:hypothetical protein